MKRPWRSGTVAASFAAALTLALAAPQPAAAKDPVIRNVFKFPNGWWPTKIQQEVQEQAKKLGVDYQITGPQGGDVAKQVDMIEGFVSDKVDVLIVSSLGPASCQAVDDAVRDGIKVVMADSDCPQSKRIAFFGSKDAGTRRRCRYPVQRGDQGQGRAEDPGRHRHARRREPRRARARLQGQAEGTWRAGTLPADNSLL